MYLALCFGFKFNIDKITVDMYADIDAPVVTIVVVVKVVVPGGMLYVVTVVASEKL